MTLVIVLVAMAIFISILVVRRMKPKVKKNGTWQEAKPVIKQEETWTDAEKVFVKNEGTWELSYENGLTITLSGTHTNFNLFTAIGMPEQNNIVVNIPRGLVLNASDSGVPAFTLGNAYVGKHITINNDGAIYGRGGRGGGGGANGSRGGNGAAGGTALNVRQAANPVTLNNSGQIFGGGGGAGGGGSYRYEAMIRLDPEYDPRPFRSNLISNGGKGGDGGTGGGGHGGVPSVGWRPASDAWVCVLGGNGGVGGRYGLNGASGQHSSAVITQGAVTKVFVNSRGLGGAGGRGGYAIEGKNKVNLVNTGQVVGAQVN
ncbi:hypothetical protein ACRZ5S_14555 [Vibrio scophthalmi]|uniref:WAG22 antigen n=1 Tax=Vibrio scophthalmi TaxID=45658 RepID=A0A1E3WJ67_9VIBR|nr:hypothetical protein [Vibrio scophthalmi]ODS09824.1 WAG22 antigen [Vibrio scophthalmi]ODS10098.1 WAG22 antigen [Vibrio scophthalmi]